MHLVHWTFGMRKIFNFDKMAYAISIEWSLWLSVRISRSVWLTHTLLHSVNCSFSLQMSECMHSQSMSRWFLLFNGGKLNPLWAHHLPSVCGNRSDLRRHIGLVLLVVAFVCFRKHYVSRKKHKSGCVQDSNGYFPTLPKSMMKETEISSPMELSTLIGSLGNLDNSPFRSLKPREQRELGPQVGSRSRPQGPVICSVAPNLPPPPSTSSDNDSIMKNNWEHDYEGENEFYLLFSQLQQALHFIWNLVTS